MALQSFVHPHSQIVYTRITKLKFWNTEYSYKIYVPTYNTESYTSDEVGGVYSMHVRKQKGN